MWLDTINLWVERILFTEHLFTSVLLKIWQSQEIIETKLERDVPISTGVMGKKNNVPSAHK